MAIKFQIIMATYNRSAVTLACIESLLAIHSDRYVLSIFVCDDRSTDSTLEEIRDRFPQVDIVSTNGDLFWARTMHEADLATEKQEYDYLVWMNDDTKILPNLFDLVLEDYELLNDQKSILVGSLRDPDTLERTYSGCTFSIVNNKIELDFISPMGIPVQIGMFSGNFVCIPRETRNLIGPISSKFRHGWADMEYGLRALKFGVPSFLMSTHVGYSALNPLYAFHTDPKNNLKSRLKHAFGRKGYHPLDYARFCVASFGFRGFSLYWKNMARLFKEVYSV